MAEPIVHRCLQAPFSLFSPVSGRFMACHGALRRLDGRDYCMGGSGLLGFKTVSRHGLRSFESPAFCACLCAHWPGKPVLGGAFPLVVQTFVET